MAPRAPTAYFLFADEHRAAVKGELQAAGEKAGVAQIAKGVGAKWQALGDEEKARYQQLAAQRAQELAGKACCLPAAARLHAGLCSSLTRCASLGAAAAAVEQQQEGEQEAEAGASKPKERELPPFGLPTSVRGQGQGAEACHADAAGAHAGRCPVPHCRILGPRASCRWSREL